MSLQLRRARPFDSIYCMKFYRCQVKSLSSSHLLEIWSRQKLPSHERCEGPDVFLCVQPMPSSPAGVSSCCHSNATGGWPGQGSPERQETGSSRQLGEGEGIVAAATSIWPAAYRQLPMRRRPAAFHKLPMSIWPAAYDFLLASTRSATCERIYMCRLTIAWFEAHIYFQQLTISFLRTQTVLATMDTDECITGSQETNNK